MRRLLGDFRCDLSPQRAAFLTVLLLELASVPLGAADDVIIKAMRDELQRSMQSLRLNDLDKPYFIAYSVQDGTTRAATATLGSLTNSAETRVRLLSVEVRVGDYALDNTNFLSLPFGTAGVTRLYGGTLAVTLDDDYKELRRQMWLATDSAYKKALEDLARKRSALRNKTQAEQLPDFSREEPVTITDDAPPVAADLPAAERIVKDLSATFRKMSGIFSSAVRFRASNVRTYYLNSEGTSFTRLTPSLGLVALAGTQASDGMPLQDFFPVFGRSMNDLPDRPALVARIQEMGERLEKLREAPLLERYNGPVLFEGQAAAELFNQVFAPRLLATRRPVADSPQVDAALAAMDNPFLDKLGARVLPESISVVDNPTLAAFGGTPLAIHYLVDDEGVRARETRLVEHGVLKALLTTRSPVTGIAHSTGSRRGAGIVPSNLIVTSDGGLSQAALRERFIQLLKQRGKEYGIIVRRLGNPALKVSPEDVAAMFMQRGRDDERVDNPPHAYKLFLDGREELVRNIELSGLSVGSFKDIVATSDTPTVYTAPLVVRTMGVFQTVSLFEMAQGEGGTSMVSVAVPSLLFDDVTVRKPGGQIPKLPVLKNPFFDR